MFNAFLSPRAASATPEERLGASTERPSRSMWPSPGRRVARPPHYFTRLRLSSLRAAARGFAAAGLPTGGIQVPLLLEDSRPHAGDRATLLLSGSQGWAPLIPLGTRRFTAHRRLHLVVGQPSSLPCVSEIAPYEIAAANLLSLFRDAFSLGDTPS